MTTPPLGSKILHIDDDDRILNLTSNVLRRTLPSIVYYQAKSEAAAMAELKEFQFDLVLCDGHLTIDTTGDGAELAARIHTELGIKVAIVSSDTTLRYAEIPFVNKNDWRVSTIPDIVLQLLTGTYKEED